MTPPPAVVILAGGEATRLPGKLHLDAGGRPLVLRVYRNVRDAGPVYVAAAGSFPPEIDRELDCPIIVDRWPRRGPAAALYSAFEQIPHQRIFVVAGDAPFVTAATARELTALWEPSLQAVVPVNAAGPLEPLCALYDRLAFLAAAAGLRSGGSGGVAAVVEELRAKRVHLSDERVFANVNTAADRRALLQA